MSDNSVMQDYAEKRDFIRMQINAGIELTILSTGETVAALCKDLSGMGMLLELKQPLEVGTEVQTALPSNARNFPTFKTTARVVRYEHIEGGYLAGLQIVNIEQ